MQIDFSILIPGIRTHNWITSYETAKQSCGKHSFEMIFAGPFDPPAELNGKIKFVKTYSSPSVACMKAATQAEGRLLMNCPDDARFAPGFDKSIELWDSINQYKNVVNVRFTEGFNFAGPSLPPHYWSVNSHHLMRQVGIPRNYRLALGPMMSSAYFRELGGLDCLWEYPNFNSHDLAFRVQYDGGTICDSPTDVMICDYYTNRAMDHGAIEDAYEDDVKHFVEKYSNPNALNPDTIHIDFDNWKKYDTPWKRRFSKKMPTTYEELLAEIKEGNCV